MALSATIFKAQLNISDLRRHHYQDYTLTLALHPSETEERMLVRLLCFCLYASDSLEFTKGLSSDDEPDIWQKSLSDEIELWIELGQPDEKRVRKASGRSEHVVIAGFQQRPFSIWWEQQKSKLERFDNVSVLELQGCDQLGQIVKRTMNLQLTIDDNTIWLTDETINLEIPFQYFNNATEIG
ncbi:YaeQ family protein [Bacterioplanoides sp. SCSIO 12839]|uniref:YaeQ family protein n=1 Tax=Bacterioplanoides sp. SCSIO 12839 TaxID=2829569 RepID=UPI002103EB55|nr:YaeQ family protein [Bacterioplanoides sp. SCSIO 12839]UTW47324.1 YaeQ family protein [Bacterioplanoides sp. SCSIO 12839]